MTPKKLALVRRICQQSAIPKDWVLCMDSLSVVLYENRAQESIIYEKMYSLSLFVCFPLSIVSFIDTEIYSIPLKSNHVEIHIVVHLQSSPSFHLLFVLEISRFPEASLSAGYV